MAGKGKGLWNVIFWAALIVCVCALGVLGFIFYSYWSADKGYEDLAAAAHSADSTTDLADMTVDWDYLRSINSDIVAWVYMPGTNIDYPVVQTDNNDTYLTMDFNQSEGFSARCGTIFLDCDNAGDLSDTNSIMYGHHMNDGSMFACISKQLSDNEEFNANRIVYVFTPERNYQCQTFALLITDAYDEILQANFADAQEREDYVLDKENRSQCVPSEGMPDPASVEKMFTFSTCDYTKNNGRAVLFAQVINEAVPGGSDVGVNVGEDSINTVQDVSNKV